MESVARAWLDDPVNRAAITEVVATADEAIVQHLEGEREPTRWIIGSIGENELELWVKGFVNKGYGITAIEHRKMLFKRKE